MIALLQRVRQAHVEINQQKRGQIEQGLLVFVGFEPGDSEPEVSRLLDRILTYRVFADADDKMNLSVQDIQGGLLLVPQFTLAADTGRGRRPSFTSAAAPAEGKRLFEFMLRQTEMKHANVACGEFAADMQVYLQNDGPVTFLLKN